MDCCSTYFLWRTISSRSSESTSRSPPLSTGQLMRIPGRKPIRMCMGMLSFRRLSLFHIIFTILLCRGLRMPRTSDLDGICIHILSLSMVRIVYVAFSGHHTLTFLRQYHYLHARRPFCICDVHRIVIEEHGIISSTPHPPYILPTFLFSSLSFSSCFLLPFVFVF